MAGRTAEIERAYAGETLALIGALALMVAVVGGLFAGLGGAAVAVVCALILARGVVGLSTAGVMRANGARPIGPSSAPRLTRLAAHLARNAQLAAPPTLYLVPSRAPNAFAFGDRNDSGVALSQGLVQALDERELTGVLAHEISHVRAGDTHVLRIAGALVATIRAVAQIGLLLCIVALFLGERVPLVVALTFAVAPTLAFALQLWVSRRREFAADAGAVALTGDAVGLASALCRLDRWRARLRYLGYALGAPPTWLSTHPRTEERLRRLHALQPEAFLPAAPRRVLWSW
ncbi:MAG: zinc metalloprotease HtpX [Pseudomonadota bacterium]